MKSVSVLPSADRDIFEIIAFIAEDNPVKAFEVAIKIKEDLLKLKQFPLLGKVLNHPEIRFKNYRILIVEGYFVYCTIENDWVFIHRILHSNQDFVSHLA